MKALQRDLNLVKAALMTLDDRIEKGKTTDPDVIALGAAMTLLVGVVEGIPHAIASELRKLRL